MPQTKDAKDHGENISKESRQTGMMRNHFSAPAFLLSLEIDGVLRILVVADTHNKLPQKIVDLARDADEIWHLGDVCAQIILDELRATGPPVTIVRGNCDSNSEWPLVVDLTRDGLKFRLQHIPPESPPDDVDVVLHGHTHLPRNEKRGGVLFLNPG